MSKPYCENKRLPHRWQPCSTTYGDCKSIREVGLIYSDDQGHTAYRACSRSQSRYYSSDQSRQLTTRRRAMGGIIANNGRSNSIIPGPECGIITHPPAWPEPARHLTRICPILTTHRPRPHTRGCHRINRAPRLITPATAVSRGDRHADRGSGHQDHTEVGAVEPLRTSELCRAPHWTKRGDHL